MMHFRSAVFLLAFMPLPFNVADFTSQISAAANSGGNHADGGQVITTGSASVSVQTVITSDNLGSTSTVQVTTSSDGVTNTSEETKTYPPNTPVTVVAATSASSLKSMSREPVAQPKAPVLYEVPGWDEPATTSQEARKSVDSNAPSLPQISLILRFLGWVGEWFKW